MQGELQLRADVSAATQRRKVAHTHHPASPCAPTMEHRCTTLYRFALRRLYELKRDDVPTPLPTQHAQAVHRHCYSSMRDSANSLCKLPNSEVVSCTEHAQSLPWSHTVAVCTLEIWFRAPRTLIVRPLLSFDILLCTHSANLLLTRLHNLPSPYSHTLAS